MDRRDHAIGPSGEKGIEPMEADIGLLLDPAVALPFAPDASEEERQPICAREPAIDDGLDVVRSGSAKADAGTIQRLPLS